MAKPSVAVVTKHTSNSSGKVIVIYDERAVAVPTDHALFNGGLDV
jgi:hypothetical protein